MKTLAILATALVFALAPRLARSEDLGTATRNTAHDVKKSVRKNSRDVKDKTCELVHGKLECAGKKLKHKAENVGDDLNK
jgi:hypothetical protein